MRISRSLLRKINYRYLYGEIRGGRKMRTFFTGKYVCLQVFSYWKKLESHEFIKQYATKCVVLCLSKPAL
jgi:hypothetical protein